MLTFGIVSQITENTVIDQIVLETALGDQTLSVTQFKGAVVVDPNLGNYVVIDFTVTDTTAMDICRIRLKSGQNVVAVSDDKQLLIVKEANKNLKVRLAAQFDGAEKCKFNTTSVNLPYATPFREGVVRFTNGDEANKSGTVYSAKDVDTKINEINTSLGNLDQYAKKATENTFTENNTFTKNVIVNGEIGGDAVATTATANEKDTLVVSVGFANDKYLSKTEASNTYLTQTDAETAAGNYAKLDGVNTFTGQTNTFNEVRATNFSGDGVVNAISESIEEIKLPTSGAVRQAINDVKTTLSAKDNDLQSQIDGINAGQNLADIVYNTTELATYDVSHLKAKNDFQHGSDGDTWAIGDKVQVLGGGDTDAPSCVYELIKGTKPEDETNSIQSTNNTAYYWHYIGVYGANAYTKAEIDSKLGTINNTLDTKVDKTQIITTISDDTATATNVPSSSAVKTYVDNVANALPNKYVTIDTAQEITGAKKFANGTITIANPNDSHKDKHYVWITATGDNTTADYTSSVEHYDLTHNDTASDLFIRARGSDDVYYTSDLTRFNSENNAQFNTRLYQNIGTHYKYTTSDILVTTNIRDVPAAQIGTPGNEGSADSCLTENYVERIRLRKNTSVAGDTDVEFLPAGQSVTDIDLFADNINNVFNHEVSFRVCTTSGEGDKTDTSVLSIHSSGIYYHTPEGNSISTTEYQLRTAGSLDFTKDMSELVGSDSYVPTTKAVADFVDNKIAGVTGGTEFVKTKAPGTNQNIESAITVTDGITVGSNEAPANLTVSGIITGNAVASQAIDPAHPNQLTTSQAVTGYVNEKLIANQEATSDKTKVGAMGLFLYTGGDQKAMGDYVLGTSLQAVGMQLPMDGVVSWSQGETMPDGSTWKLLNNTIAGEPCLVLAIRTA